jgi:ApbE superfamily uncharacterized protein (UPF0280 family)
MNGEIFRVNERTILAHYGPMTLTIQAWGPDGADIDLAVRAGEFSFNILPRIASARELFRRGARPLRRPLREPILESMCQAVERVGQSDLGPMAAVAGAVADEVVGWLVRAGAVKAIVENGGDISLYLAPDQRTVVGVRTRLENRDPAYAIELRGTRGQYWGVATSSGLGGRGLNRGLAEAAVCIASSGAAADAAATAVSNSCTVESAAITRVPAEALDPDTDIPGLLVTANIGELSEAEIDSALDSAENFARTLVDTGVIFGSYIFLRNKERLTAGFAKTIAQLVKIEGNTE